MTYRPNTTRGTGVDTLTARYITRRTEFDPVLDIGTDRLRSTRGGTGRPPDPVPNGSAPDPLRR